jgi:ribosomal protein L28
MANIQKVTLNVGDEKVSGKFCTKCIKRLKMEVKQKVATA